MKFQWIASLALFVTLFSLSVRAEDGASGHYLPGLVGSYFDALPGKPGFAVNSENNANQHQTGAQLGSFQGRTAGIGPVISYARNESVECVAEVKWLPELQVQNRTERDYRWFKVGAAF